MATKTRTIFGLSVTFPGGSVAEITGYKRKGHSRKKLESTHTLSPDGWMEFFRGAFKDPGELELDINADPDGFDFVGVLEEPDGQIVVTLPLAPGQTVAGTFESFGGVTDYEDEGKLGDKITGSVTLMLSGKPVLTPGS